MASPISFQGLSTNLPTDQLINAIITQESQPMVRMQARQAQNNKKSAALSTIRTDLTSLNTAMSSLVNGGFNGRSVTSSDATNSDVTATASGGAPGVYDVTVANVATRSRLLVPADGVQPADQVGKGDYQITDMNGKTATITIGDANNSLLGLRDAINNYKDKDGNALNVNATVIQVGSNGASKLVLSANNTGTGSAGADTFSLTPPVNSTLNPAGTLLTSSQAVNAHFSVNGVDMERASNTVTDAADGVTFNLKAGASGKTTTLTVGLDKAAITSAMQDVVTKYNTLYNDYKSRTTSTTAADGTITSGVFNNDSAVRGMINQVHSAIMGANTNLPATASFTAASSIGVKTNRDGTLSLDTTAFQAALDKDTNGVTSIFNNTGTSTSPLLSFLGATTNTTTTPINFSVVKGLDGVTTATLDTMLPGATTSTTTTLTSTTGYFYGAAGTPFEGLALKASDGATGTLTISKGVGQSITDLVRNLTSSGAGDIGGILQNITTQNNTLTNQIYSQQERLDRRKASLQKLYANLEMTVGQLNAAGQSISSM